MKHRTKFRHLAILTAAMTAFTLTGCGRGSSGSTLEVSFDHAYSANQVDNSGVNINGFLDAGDYLLMLGNDEDYNMVYQMYNKKDGTVSAFDTEYHKQATDEYMIDIMGIMPVSDGGYRILYVSYEVMDNWEDIQQVYYLETYDNQMNVVSGQDVTETIPEGCYFYNLTGDKNGNSYCIGSDDEGMNYISVRDQNFKETGVINVDAEWLESMFCGNDGTVYVSGYSDRGGMMFGRINTDTMSFEEISVDGMPEYFNGVFAGNETYDFFVYDSTYVYGVKTADGTCEKVISWINSDFSGDYIGGVAALPDGRFLTLEHDSEYEHSTLWNMQERPAEELEQMEIISLAALYSDMNLTAAVCNFNRANDDCRIVVKAYLDEMDDSEDAWEKGVDQFKKDMTSGKVADIICTDSLNFESFANKGIFMDIYTLMGEDYFNDETFFSNFFDAITYKEQLQRIAFSFSVETLAAKSEYVGEEDHITMERFMELVKNPPNGMEVFPKMTKDQALYTLCMANMSSYYVDTVNATCSFNTPDFVELLELCNTFPEYEEIDYDNMTDQQWDLYWEEREMAYRNDKALFKDVYFDRPEDIYEITMGDFGTEDVTFIGYPVKEENVNGGILAPSFTISVSSQTNYKEEIRSFIDYMLSPEYQRTLSWEMPVRRDVFRELGAEAVNSTEEYEKYYYLANETFDIGYPTQESIDRMEQYISGLNRSRTYDESIYEIVYEEADMFLKGDQTAQQAADMIQSRVSLYLSEQA